jgi:hypothetical protein
MSTIVLTRVCACLHVHDSLYSQVYDTAELGGDVRWDQAVTPAMLTLDTM